MVPWCVILHQALGDTSRPVYLQVAESAYRFTLGAIAGGELSRGRAACLTDTRQHLISNLDGWCLVWVSVFFTQLRERRPCIPSTWWRLVCRTRGPQDPLLESWCTRTALTAPRRCFATRASSASIEVGTCDIPPSAVTTPVIWFLVSCLFLFVHSS